MISIIGLLAPEIADMKVSIIISMATLLVSRIDSFSPPSLSNNWCIQPSSSLSLSITRASPHSTFSQLSSSKNDNHGINNSNDEDDSSKDDNDDFQFMTSLKNRMEEVRNQDTICPIIILDCMLPRQVMRIRIDNPGIVKLVKRQLRNDTPTFGVRGTTTTIISTTTNKSNDNKKSSTIKKEVSLTNGVEVEIITKPVFIEEDAVLVALKAKRRFQVLKEVEHEEQRGWVDANVQYLDSETQEEEELMSNTEDDPMCLDRAILKAIQLSDFVKEWLDLAKKVERQPGQIDLLLEDLGDMPCAEEPSERAFWVGALINPLPDMGVADRGVRPAMIMATTAEERVDIALDGIIQSIKHMDGSAPLW